MSGLPRAGNAAGFDGRDFYRPGGSGRQQSAPAHERPGLWLRIRWVRLRMSDLTTIQIIGSPVACADGVKDTWRDLAGYLAGKLKSRYGTAVSTTYYDLFDPDCPPLPPDSQLPLVLVNGEVLTSGGKLSMPILHRHLDALGVQPQTG
jgi:hypothetical protein